MAAIFIDGIDQVMQRLAGEETNFRSRVTRAMELAAGQLREQILLEESTSFKAPTGELGDTVGWKKIQFTTSGAEVLVHYIGNYYGRRGGGEVKGEHAPRRAGFVAAMQEHRNKNPFNRRAMNEAGPRINSILAEQLSIDRYGVTSDWGGL